MRTMVLGAAALVAVAVPAAATAEQRSGSGWTGTTEHGSVRIHRGHDRDGDRLRRGEWRRDDDRDRRRDDDGDSFGDDFERDGREYQGDTLWRPDSFNDWWHERPHRSYPAWVARNRDCNRLWWSGGDWRC